MKSDYYEITLSFPRNRSRCREALILFIKQAGISREQIIETDDLKHSQIRIYFTEKRRSSALIKKVLGLELLRVSVSQRLIVYRDWADKWKESYQIQNIGKRFVVIPAWRKNEFKSSMHPRRIPVWIDPLSAFGSGEHETTQLMTRMMEAQAGKFHSFLDAGTGSGILSVFAAHLGAKTICGFDSDKPSAKCAQFNFNQNQIKGVQTKFFCSELARYRSAFKYDLVAANINSRILEDHRNVLVRAVRSGGRILLCGILKQTYGSFREAFDGDDVRCVRILRGRRWVSVLYQKQSR